MVKVTMTLDAPRESRCLRPPDGDPSATCAARDSVDCDTPGIMVNLGMRPDGTNGPAEQFPSCYSVVGACVMDRRDASRQ